MERNSALVEWMDKPDCDPDLLVNTYRQFTMINKLLSGWGGIYRKIIRPLLLSCSTTPSILDIGCGGGDILRYLKQRCEADGIEARFTGIDPDSRSMDYLSGLPPDPAIHYRNITSSELLSEGSKFDLVLSNHLMHHLTDTGLLQLLKESDLLSKKMVLFSDIERNRMGYSLFRMFAPLLFRNSYIVEDGLISIKKSYKKKELSSLIPDEFGVERKFPFRILLIKDKTV